GTTRSADGRSISVTRDTNGDGHLDDTETIATAANGVVTDVIARLNPDGSLRDRTTTTTSADGNTVTVTQDLNADGIIDAKTVRAIVLRSEEHTSELQSLTNLVCRL